MLAPDVVPSVDAALEPLATAPGPSRWACRESGPLLRLAPSEPLAQENPWLHFESPEGELWVHPSPRALELQWRTPDAAPQRARGPLALRSSAWQLLAGAPLGSLLRRGVGPDATLVLAVAGALETLGALPGEGPCASAATGWGALLLCGEALYRVRFPPGGLERREGPAEGAWSEGESWGSARREGDRVLLGGGPEARELALAAEPCGGASRGALLLRAEGALRAREGDFEHALALWEERGLEGARACVRELRGAVEQLGAPGWLRVRWLGTQLRGVARLRAGLLPVRCEREGGGVQTPSHGRT